MDKQKVKKIIVVLGGALKKVSPGYWRTTTFDDAGDNFGVQGDRLRVVAAAYLAAADPDSLILVSGGKGQLTNVAEAPTVASVIKKELIDLGLPARRIREEDQSGTTYQQLLALQKIIRQDRPDKVIIISNLWHLPRIQAFLDYRPELPLARSVSELQLVDAEKVAIENDSATWTKIIESAYNSKAMKSRMELEQRGVREIKNDHYRLNN